MTNGSEEQHSHYLAGAREARTFRAGSHLLQQQVFKAETADHKIRVDYDDVEFGNLLTVTFKNRYRGGEPLTVDMQFGSARAAFARALAFLASHPVQEPHCSVDY